jgi:ATP-binding cassette, subfamily B, bacterial
MKFPFFRQFDSKDCGPTCLRMICKYHGKSLTLQFLRQKCEISKQGVTLLGISKAAEAIGFKTLAAKISYAELLDDSLLPCIVHWNQNHFVVVYKISKKFVYVADPGKNLIKYTKQEFLRHWVSTRENHEPVGVVLFLEPTDQLYQVMEEDKKKGLGMSTIASYFLRYKRIFLQLGLGFIVGSVLQLVLPFLTQAVVDVGISGGDLNFITIILLGQSMIYVGSAVVDFIRSWMMLHMNTRINISLLTNFFIKLMHLPLSYFDTKMVGDIMQRLGDHSRIQSFLTGTILNFTFAIINFIVYTFIVITYDIKLFIVFFIGSALYFSWILLFLRVRKSLDYKRFAISSKNQSVTIQLIQGMQEIKLNNSEIIKRWEWERNQARLFKLNMRGLTINQIQSAGALLINQGKNVFITYLTARTVIEGNLTLGGMLAIQFIIGQLNGPVQQLISFIQSMQDAKISFDRINEIQGLDDEEPPELQLLTTLPANRSIYIKGLSYKYPGFENDNVLKNIGMTIPQGKTTAIVGMSGSGKTTLVKLLLRFYEPGQGDIRIGDSRLTNISHSFWRSKCGVVMQESFIFSDSIAKNIAVGEEYPDMERILHAVKVANIQEFIESLPASYNTMIGSEGTGLSQGQKQRVLIARAVYKNPEYVFFDEATNSLDANNERTIMENFYTFFKGRTVIIVAHRLSTVKKADQIIVLEKGEIVEQGTHDELVDMEGYYFNLVKNQLELEA